MCHLGLHNGYASTQIIAAQPQETSSACAGAWRHVVLKGQRRVLVPALVTGCKAWHMRDAGVFFPKASFFNTVNAIPESSEVSFSQPASHTHTHTHAPPPLPTIQG